MNHLFVYHHECDVIGSSLPTEVKDVATDLLAKWMAIFREGQAGKQGRADQERSLSLHMKKMGVSEYMCV